MNISQSFDSVVEGTLGQQPCAATKREQVVLLGILDHEATKETPQTVCQFLGTRCWIGRSLAFSREW